MPSLRSSCSSSSPPSTGMLTSVTIALKELSRAKPKAAMGSDTACTV